MRFDLRGLHDLPPLRAGRMTRWLGVAMAALFGFVTILAVAGYYIVHAGFSGWTAGSSAALVIPLFFFATALFLIGATGPDYDYLEVDSRGLAWIQSNGKELRRPWSQPQFVLTFQLTNGMTRRGVPAEPMISARPGFGRQLYVTREAYDAVVREAAEQGLGVRTGPSALVTGWSTTVIARSGSR